MKMIYGVFAILLIAFLVSGCVNVATQDKTITDDGKEPVKDTKGTDVKAPDAVPKQCAETINYQVLIDALPKTVSGYVGEEPEGNMLSFTNPTDQTVMKYSTASVRLVKDDNDVQVTAMDTCYVQYLSLAWLGFYEMEGTDGYLKKTTIGGFPGWHQYDKSSESYSYNVFVKERVIVTIQGSNGVSDSDVTAVANAVSYSSIASAAK